MVTALPFLVALWTAEAGVVSVGGLSSLVDRGVLNRVTIYKISNIRNLDQSRIISHS